MSNGPIAGRYADLQTDRENYLNRAREAARYTIPTLFPPSGATSSTKYYTPYQSMGAHGLKTLAAKLLIALLPANAPFFKLTVDDFETQNEIKQAGAQSEIDKALAQIERYVTAELERTAVRVPAFEALKQYLLAGNVLTYTPKEGGMRVYRLDHYVVVRDPSGNLSEIILKEEVGPEHAPEGFEFSPSGGGTGTRKSLELYTQVKLVGDHWMVMQELSGVTISVVPNAYPRDNNAWNAIRHTAMSGEDYGRSYIDELIGDLRSLESLTKSIVQGSAAAAKVLFLVKPTGHAKTQLLNKAANGDFIPGNPDDVAALQLGKFADFRVAQETINMLNERLARAFMLQTAVQRAGERVTAEEIRFMAGELDDGLGGMYTALSAEFQMPLAKRYMANLQRAGKLPPIPSGVSPQVVTGLTAIGRGQDLQKLQMFMQAIAGMGEQGLARVNIETYITRVATALGVSTEDLVIDQETFAAQQQQAQMMAMMQQAAPGVAQEVVKQGGGMIQQAQEGAPDQS